MKCLGSDVMNNDLASIVRSKVDIVDIIGERIPLIAKGKNFFGVCPFHDDSNPSMCVSTRKTNIYLFFLPCNRKCLYIFNEL